MASNDNFRTLTTNVFEEFRKKTNLTADSYLLCNSLPVSLLEFYPKTFDKKDIISVDNLRAIPKTFFDARNAPSIENVKHNRRFKTFYEKWSEFIENNKDVDLKRVKKFRDEMDSEFKDMFVSPAHSISEK